MGAVLTPGAGPLSPQDAADLSNGLRTLSCLPLANPPAAALGLERFLDDLRQAPPAAEVYLALLEHARIPLCFVAEELARGYLGKPLPLPARETAIFAQLVDNWLRAARAYAHCAQLGPFDTPGDDAEHAQRSALILHRCIYYTGMAIVEHQRAHRQLPPGLWLDLHGYYASAEEWGIATLTLPEVLDTHGHGTHCAAAFVSLLLSEMASPYSLTVREQRLTRRWANQWAPLLSLHAALPGVALPPFVVDLMQDSALRPAAECLQTEQLRRLESSQLAAQLAQVRQQLAQQVPPGQLGLGEDCSIAQCQHLLAQLARPWSQARAPRHFRRHATPGLARVCTGFEAMHYAVAGVEFTQPENARIYSRQEFDSLFTFRHMVDPTQQLQIKQGPRGYESDIWEVVNQSANGFRLIRSIAGRQMEHRQLLALCPNEGGRYLLAYAAWLMQEQGGGLVAGIAALPGMPQAVAARPLAQHGAHSEMYGRAFLLTAVPAGNGAPSLVVPQGWFRAGRIIEIYTETPWRAQLLQMLEDGPDFERVSFVPC